MIQNASKTAQSEDVLRQVTKVHRSKQSRDWGFALLVGAAVLAITMLLAMAIESQLNLFSHTFRFALTFASLAATVLCTWMLFKRGKRTNERLVSAAKDIDSAYPRLEQRVSTLTSCKEDRLESQQLVHPAMLRLLTQETAAMHYLTEPKPIVSYRMFKLPAICLGCAGLVLAGFFLWDAPKTLVQLGRFCAPWSNLSTTNVTAVDANLVAARGEPLKLTASLAGRPVEEVVFLSQDIDGSNKSTSRIWPSKKDNTVASVRQSKAVQSFDYRFRAGDGQTQLHRVTVADRPKIEDLTMRIVPPAYTGESTKTYRQRLPKKLRVVAGSRLEVEVKPKQGVRTARLAMGENYWLPMEQSNGVTYEGALELRQPVNFEVQLTELHGLVNRRPPRCELKVVADEAPKVKILKPTKAAVLLPDEAIDIHFKASDDHGIQEMALRVYTQREGEEGTTVHEVEIPIDPEKNRKIKGSVELDLAQFGLKDGDTIRYEIRASDNFRPQEGDQSNLLPMEDVELVETNSSANPQNGANTVAAPADSDQSNPALAKTNSKGNSNDASKRSPAQPPAEANAGSSDNAVAQPDSVSPKQSAEQPPADSVAEDSAKDSDRDSTQVAPQNSDQNIASNENKIESKKLPADDTNKDSASSVIRSNKDVSPANGSQAAADSSSPPKSNASAGKSGQSSQASPSQQANSSSQNNSDSDSDSSPAPKSDPDMVAKPKQPAPEKAEQDPAESTAAMANKATPSSDMNRGQSSSTGQQKIKVDKYADGFNSGHRKELEIAIAPTFELLKESLINAGESVREVISDPTTGQAADEALASAADDLQTGSEAVSTLNEETKNTPYTFMGLRLESIRAADVEPAHKEVLEATQTQDEERLQHASVGWNHISRALASIGKLEAKYDQVKRDLKRADDILEFKKMHRLFIENAMEMLNPTGNPAINKQSRKAAEYDLDEEYLARLKEVMEMRRDMMAELARILADDPQLLRRYMNGMNDQTNTIRDQLSLIAYDQDALSQSVLRWSDATTKPPELASHKLDVLETHLAEIEEIANQLADVQNEFVSWLPLVESAEKGEAADAVAQFKAAGVGLTEIMADVETIFAGGAQADATGQIEPLLSKSTKVEKQLSLLARTLRQLNKDSTDPEIVNNTARRVPKLQVVQRDMQLWAGKLELLGDDMIHEVYSVDQETRRDQLLKYSVKLASLESQLLGGLGRAFQDQDVELPAGVADNILTLQKMADVEIPSAQLLAAQALLDGNAKLANLQQQEIKQDFEKAEDTFDEILQAIADELDKLPPVDPIASMLEDPTLDEILAQLEREQDYFEELGLSLRPSNLMRMGYGRRFGGSMASGMMSRLQQMRRLANRAYRRALERARTEAEEYRKPKLAKETVRWNVLVGQLGDDMLQGDKRIPPERFRRAIEHYTDQISRLENDQEVIE